MIPVSSTCLAAALLIVSGGSVAFGDASAQRTQVLVLYSFSYGMPANLDWDRGIRLGLEANLHEPVDIDVEFLEVEQLPDREGRDKWVELLRMKYADSAPDVVIPVGDSAAACLAVEHPDLFPQAAVVFCSVSAETLSPRPTLDSTSPKRPRSLYLACTMRSWGRASWAGIWGPYNGRGSGQAPSRHA